MRRPKNPFPGVTRTVDRHGKIRWRFRKQGFSTYLKDDYNSAEFRAAYEAALAGAKCVKVANAAPGTLKWLCEQYLRSPRYQDLADSSKRVLRREFDWLMDQAGNLPFAKFETKHVEALMMKKEGPSASNKVKKNLSLLFNFAIRRGDGATFNPARYAVRRKENADGFYTWTEADIGRFEARHPSGTKARLALELALNTGAARQDLAAMGWANIGQKTIRYARGKSGVVAELPILLGLAAELLHVPHDQFLFLTHSGGRAYKPTTFGNWFKDRAIEAGVTANGANTHGLRKAGATRLADHGATEWEIAAYLGHEDTTLTAVYVKKANRSRLGASGMARLSRTNPEQNLSNLSDRLDIPPLKNK